MANLYPSRGDSSSPPTSTSSTRGACQSLTCQPPAKTSIRSQGPASRTRRATQLNSSDSKSTNLPATCTLPLDGSYNNQGDSPFPISTLMRRRLLIFEDSTKGDEIVLDVGTSPRGELHKAPTVKIDENKRKVDKAPAAEEGFPSIPTSRSSSARRSLKTYEETLKEMMEKWAQYVVSRMEPLGSGPVLQPH
ncbi:hypothetical protein Salat_0634400 [Sesamum alatum]|uniref:Uncharacterized protein n=1 Tax=Sesamum alatum TaxID=300844 RepID=A0AAE1YRL1_9LAMI|nr:hypothetical protein Salat_0634400 [Sesamum alatum]